MSLSDQISEWRFLLRRTDSGICSFGFGPEIGRSPTLVAGSYTANFLLQSEPVTEEQMRDYLTGWSHSLAIGGIDGAQVTATQAWFDSVASNISGSIEGAQATQTPETGWALGAGLFTPQVGYTATYTVILEGPPSQPPIQPWEPSVPMGDNLYFPDLYMGMTPLDVMQSNW